MYHRTTIVVGEEKRKTIKLHVVHVLKQHAEK